MALSGSYGSVAYFNKKTILGIYWDHGRKFVLPSDPEWAHVAFAWRSSLFSLSTYREHMAWCHWCTTNR
jgi:hypothetical protein